MRRIFCLFLLVSIFYACKNSNSTKGVASTSVKSVIRIKNTIHPDLKLFWAAFTAAVNRKDIQAINQLTYFPLHNLHPCYMPAIGKTRLTDTAGLSPEDFKHLMFKVFDDETSWLTITPADSLYLYSKKDDDKSLPLQYITDNQTPIYIYPVVYDRGKTGGTKSLYFGSVRGTYKLIWIDCDGNITGHR